MAQIAGGGGVMPLIVRFNEWQEYNISVDEPFVRFTGVTNRGSFHAYVPVGRASSLRDNRKRFREKVIACMQEGRDPCEIEMEDEREAV